MKKRKKEKKKHRPGFAWTLYRSLSGRRDILATARTLRPVPHETQARAMTVNPQTYKFGWYFAISSVLSAYSSLREGYHAYAYPHVAFLQVALDLVQGVAAVMITPGAWYTLIFSFPLTLMMLLPSLGGQVEESSNWAKLMLPASLIFNILVFAYFYKRRAMFGASRRWTVLERWCPIIVGPDHYIGEPPSLRRFLLGPRLASLSLPRVLLTFCSGLVLGLMTIGIFVAIVVAAWAAASVVVAPGARTSLLGILRSFFLLDTPGYAGGPDWLGPVVLLSLAVSSAFIPLLRKLSSRRQNGWQRLVLVGAVFQIATLVWIFFVVFVLAVLAFLLMNSAL